MSEIKIGRVVLGMVSTNCYFVFREDGNEVIVFDPADEGAKLHTALKDMGKEVAAICLTHGHFDHILGVAKLRQLSHCKLYANELEAEMLSDENINMSNDYGIACTATADVNLKDGEKFTVAGIEIEMLATPGHTPGGCCYYIKEAGMLISGDTLFEGSVGRTDFPGGSAQVLVDSIKTKLLVLPDDTQVYPGHGGMTTIGDEKKYNPFLA